MREEKWRGGEGEREDMETGRDSQNTVRLTVRETATDRDRQRDRERHMEIMRDVEKPSEISEYL